MKRIIFTVTNDLVFDQRMERICGTLACNGYDCVLIGRKGGKSQKLSQKNYEQVRIPCWFSKGKAFYIEYNLKLLWYLLFRKTDIFCAIDLDTALPVWVMSKLKRKTMVYDAHEFFSEMEEIISRPLIHKAWVAVEKFILKRVKYGYTISDGYARLFKERYNADLKVIRNAPRIDKSKPPHPDHKFIIYQGVLNVGRGLEASLAAMQKLEGMELQIFGAGPKEKELKQLAKSYKLNGHVKFKGPVRPENLKTHTTEAWLGLTLFSEAGLHHRYSLANRFFDYMHAGIPQVAMNYPEYRAFNEKWEVALLIDELSPQAIEAAIQQLVEHPEKYEQLKANCKEAREHNSWNQEAIKLIDFYKRI